MRGDLVEGRGDRLDLLVVGRHAGADQAVGRGEAVEHVDLDDEVLLLQQVVGGIEAVGRADDGDSQGAIVGSGLAHGGADSSIAAEGPRYSRAGPPPRPRRLPRPSLHF